MHNLYDYDKKDNANQEIKENLLFSPNNNSFCKENDIIYYNKQNPFFYNNFSNDFHHYRYYNSDLLHVKISILKSKKKIEYKIVMIK